MTDNTETLPEMPKVEMPAPEQNPAPTPTPESQERPDNVEPIKAKMTPKQILEMKEREEAILDKAASVGAKMLTPVVRFARDLGWVKKIDENWRAKKAEMTEEELKGMWVESNWETLKGLVPDIVPGLSNIPNPKETIFKTLLLTGAIGSVEDEKYISLAGTQNAVQKGLLFLIDIWGKTGDPDGKAVKEFVEKSLSIEGFALAVCKKLRQNIHNPELTQAQPVVAEVHETRERTSADVNVPEPSHIDDENEHTAEAAA